MQAVVPRTLTIAPTPPPLPNPNWNFTFYDVMEPGTSVIRGLARTLAFARCPSNSSPAWAWDYDGNQEAKDRFFNANYSIARGDIHHDGVLGVYKGRKFGDISDGSSNTMAIGENSIRIVFGAIDGTSGGLTGGTGTHNNLATIRGQRSGSATDNLTVGKLDRLPVWL